MTTRQEAHALGLLTIHEAVKLLDMRYPDLIDEISAGNIESQKVGTTYCFSLAAIDAYRSRAA